MRWSKWEVNESFVVSPRRVRLIPAEMRIMRVLMERRLAEVGKAPTFMPLEDLCAAAGIGSVAMLRRRVSTLRTAIGQDAIEKKYGFGYRLMPVHEQHRTNMSPIDVLVEDLSSALAAAKRLQESLKEGLYNDDH